MFFSEKFNVNRKVLNDFGAVDISLVCDMPLFVDPMLIFNSEKREYKQLHQQIIKYFYFLYSKAQKGLSAKEINAWFNFSEVKNNWLGYSLVGNEGTALGAAYSKFLYDNIKFAIDTNSISKSPHIEKVMLLHEGSGKDKISDLTVNLIKDYLLEYTQEFTTKYIDQSLTKKITVDEAYFNYETESFAAKEYTLPYVIKKGRQEYILLTPMDILREDEPSINRRNFIDNYQRVLNAIENDSLRAYVNNYLAKAVAEREEQSKKKRISDKTIVLIEKAAFKEALSGNPEIYDYYIKMRESDTEEIRLESQQELLEQLFKFESNAKELISNFVQKNYKIIESLSAREEAQKRLIFFKHIIEDCDGYKNFYFNGKRITSENDLQRLFKYVWYGTAYKVNFECNNGRGPADVLISMGQNNQNIVEFKLASNTNLEHVFEQVKIYENANQIDGSLIAIFYFSEDEFEKAQKVVKDAGHEKEIGKAIFLIDCQVKLSASRVRG